MQLHALEPLVGEWAIEIRHPSIEGVIRGATSFAWLEGGGYLIQRSSVENPDFPKGLMRFGPAAAGGRIVQHYFDSRGVARIYDVDFADGVLTLSRDDPDFAQRYSGRLSDDGTTLAGAFEICHDGATWEHDFDIAYTKVA